MQNVGTPRFYVNVLEWLASSGHSTSAVENSIFRTMPTEVLEVAADTPMPEFTFFTAKSFIAILGHDGWNMQLQQGFTNTPIAVSNVVNTSWFADIDTSILTDREGFSLGTFDGGYSYYPRLYFYGNTVSACSIILGSYYDMPHSPDLNLSMTRQMDGVKRIRTKGGNDLINNRYTNSPPWNNAAPWELYYEAPTDHNLSSKGRRIWDLSFSYLSDSDIFPMLSSLYPFDVTSPDGDVYSDGDTWHNDNQLIDSNNFYSQVIHRTNGGQLPFIFQPDNNNPNPDQFAICKLDRNFQFTQVANGVYNVKLKIREVW